MPGSSDDCLSLGYTRTSCESHPLQDVTNYLDLSSAEPFTLPVEPHLWVSLIAGTSLYGVHIHSVWMYVTFTGFIVSVWGYMQLSWLLREDVLVMFLIKNYCDIQWWDPKGVECVPYPSIIEKLPWCNNWIFVPFTTISNYWHLPKYIWINLLMLF